MIKASNARLIRPLFAGTGIGNLKQTISQSTHPGVDMTFTAPGLRISLKNAVIVIPYHQFEYIHEAAGGEVDEKKAPNANRLKGAEKLPDNRKDKE